MFAAGGNGDHRGRELYRAVLLAAAIVIAIMLVEQLATIAAALLITVIVAIIAEGTASRAQRLGLPRSLGAVFGLVLLLGTFAGVMALIVPPVVGQARRFVGNLPTITDRAVEQIAQLLGVRPARVGDELQSLVQRFVENPELLLGPLAAVGMTMLTVLAGIVVVVVSAYFMAARPEPLVHAVLRLFPPGRRDEAAHVMARLRHAWIGWLRGVAVDMVVTGVLLYAGLAIVGVEFALLFAVFSALLVVVPYFGSIVGGIPPVLFALTQSPGKALMVLGIYLAVQQIEGNVIVPAVMSKTVRLHPAAIAIGVVVVAQLLGIVGLIVAVPIISTVAILIEELWIAPRERHARETSVGAQLTADAVGEPGGAEGPTRRFGLGGRARRRRFG